VVEDKFANEMLDKMNNGVSRLSPIARRLYFSLSFEFLSRGRENTLKTALLSYAKYLGITGEQIVDISQKVKHAFDEIHTHTFVRYQFEIVTGPRPEEFKLFVSVINNSEENKAIIERVYKGNKYLH